MKIRIATLFAALSIALIAGGAGTALAAGSESGTSSVFAIGPGHTFIADVPGASSTLVRTTNGISVTLQTSGLPAGHAVTMWALIFNDPSACGAGGCHEMNGDLNIPAVQGSVYRVTGHVVGERGSFAGLVPVGDAANAVRGPGLLDPYGAEIHLIVRDHGVAETGDLLQQQFNNISPAFCNVACADVQESIHPAHE
ncbi:MAG TPA: hypothetical protein VF902_04705 [Coriobacteriia bacterium]